MRCFSCAVAALALLLASSPANTSGQQEAVVFELMEVDGSRPPVRLTLELGGRTLYVGLGEVRLTLGAKGVARLEGEVALVAPEAGEKAALRLPAARRTLPAVWQLLSRPEGRRIRIVVSEPQSIGLPPLTAEGILEGPSLTLIAGAHSFRFRRTP